VSAHEHLASMEKDVSDLDYYIKLWNTAYSNAYQSVLAPIDQLHPKQRNLCYSVKMFLSKLASLNSQYDITGLRNRFTNDCFDTHSSHSGLDFTVMGCYRFNLTELLGDLETCRIIGIQ